MPGTGARSEQDKVSVPGQKPRQNPSENMGQGERKRKDNGLSSKRRWNCVLIAAFLGRAKCYSVWLGHT